MTDVRVQAERLAGTGSRYTVPADVGRQVVVVVDAGPSTWSSRTRGSTKC